MSYCRSDLEDLGESVLDALDAALGCHQDVFHIDKWVHCAALEMAINTPGSASDAVKRMLSSPCLSSLCSRHCQELVNARTAGCKAKDMSGRWCSASCSGGLLQARRCLSEVAHHAASRPPPSAIPSGCCM